MVCVAEKNEQNNQKNQKNDRHTGDATEQQTSNSEERALRTWT